MIRAALLALLVLLPLAPLSAGQTSCEATGQVCWSESRTGACATTGTSTSEVRARSVLLGFPLTASWSASQMCWPTGSSDNMTVASGAGSTAAAKVYWESRSSGFRWIRIDLDGPMTDSTTNWVGDSGSCHIQTLGVVAGAPVNDFRACPPQLRPPPLLSYRWGDTLP